ncbi:MAG: DNA alkylation repair protein [Oscillospiraceae bacterium]|nr:DNA alkylation repair protein [Oscillospiraceae bacterium]
MTYTEITLEITALAEPEYAAFAQKLLPGTQGLLGVRLPNLRKLCKKICKQDWTELLTHIPGSFEETMLQGFVIGAADMPLNQRMRYIDTFLPKIENWSVCDSFCASLKFAREEQTTVFSYLQPLFCAYDEYTVRFACVMSLFYFINDAYIDAVMDALAGVTHTGYYAQMAVAWAFSICYLHYPQKVMQLLQANSLPLFIHNKTIQKACESRCVACAERKVLRALKRCNESFFH